MSEWKNLNFTESPLFKDLEKIKEYMEKEKENNLKTLEELKNIKESLNTEKE